MGVKSPRTLPREAFTHRGNIPPFLARFTRTFILPSVPRMATGQESGLFCPEVYKIFKVEKEKILF